MKRRLAALVLGATITTVPAIALAQADELQVFPDVSMYPVNSGAPQVIHPGPAPQAKPTVVWSMSLGSVQENPPIIHQGTLLYGTGDGRVLGVGPGDRQRAMGLGRAPARSASSSPAPGACSWATRRACCVRSTSPPVRSDRPWTGRPDLRGEGHPGGRRSLRARRRRERLRHRSRDGQDRLVSGWPGTHHERHRGRRGGLLRRRRRPRVQRLRDRRDRALATGPAPVIHGELDGRG